MTDNLRDKSVHEVCVDKTSCQSEQRCDRSIPTIRKKIEPPKPASNNDTTKRY
ncbi:hypothetical protein SOV_05390 [Sporomusa ovata DSM 2662]|nr:hypothetical protein SOV_2c11260 [Sporomusa ovata DSM 2662]